MNISLGILFTLLLTAEALYLFALSAHVARFTEIAAPVFWITSLCVLWVIYARSRPSALRMLLTGLSLVVIGAVIGFVAIVL